MNTLDIQNQSPEGLPKSIVFPEVGSETLKLLTCSDYFLAHPPYQPKAEIADYVESQGILVPRRFKTLKEAIDSGKDFIIRSEHPQDYNGVSGLVQSHHITQAEARDIPTEFKERKFTGGLGLEDIYKIVSIKDKERYLQRDNIFAKLFSKHSGISVDDFYRYLSYSIFEYISGDNFTVVEDSAIRGRYHLFSETRGYYIFDENENQTFALFPITNKQPEIFEIQKLLDVYTKVQQLSRFDSNHCPIIEIQLSYDEKVYFLQYHRGRTKDMIHDEQNLPKDFQKGIKCTFVRGITPPEGIQVQMSFSSGFQRHLLQSEGTYDAYQNLDSIFYEFHSRKVKLAVATEKDVRHFWGKATTNHFGKNQTIKPQIFVCVPGGLISRQLREKIFEISTLKQDYTLPVKIVSDGKTAYIQLLFDEKIVEEDYKEITGNGELFQQFMREKLKLLKK